MGRLLLAHLRAMTSGERFDEDLAQLERRGLLDRDGGTAVATVSFQHVLTQEVAYTTLLQADRQARHRRATDTIESLYRGRTEEFATSSPTTGPSATARSLRCLTS